nr:Chain B, octapeptide from Amyloid beta A4 protein [Homo sapiens]
KGAIIGLM